MQGLGYVDQRHLEASAGRIRPEGQDQRCIQVIGLPRAVRERIIVDTTPAIRPMLAVLDEYRRCCAVIVDRETAYAWELYLGEILETPGLPGAKRRGVGHAVNERRNDHKAEELEKRHFRQVATTLDELSETSAQIRDTARKNGDALHEVLVQMPGLLRDGGDLVREGQDVVGAARNSWFLRDMIEEKAVRTLPLDSFESVRPGGSGAQR